MSITHIPSNTNVDGQGPDDITDVTTGEQTEVQSEEETITSNSGNDTSPGLTQQQVPMRAGEAPRCKERGNIIHDKRDTREEEREERAQKSQSTETTPQGETALEMMERLEDYVSSIFAAYGVHETNA